MATKSLTFPDGGTLNVVYGGAGNGTITLTAAVNEGIDRSLTMQISGEGISNPVSVSVSQAGKREVFMASGVEFDASNGQFQVLKNGISE